MTQYARYAKDAQVLAAIGAALRGQSPDRATLPDDLRRAALAAWRRDEPEPLLPVETPEQAILRERAALLALIGLAIDRAAASPTLFLDSDTFAAAAAAAAAAYGRISYRRPCMTGIRRPTTEVVLRSRGPH